MPPGWHNASETLSQVIGSQRTDSLKYKIEGLRKPQNQSDNAANINAGTAFLTFVFISQVLVIGLLPVLAPGPGGMPYRFLRKNSETIPPQVSASTPGTTSVLG